MLAGLALLPLLSRPVRAEQPVVIFAAAPSEQLQPILTELTRDTGVGAELVSDTDDQLLARLRQHGTQADIVILNGVARVGRAAADGLLQPLALPELERAVPPALRDPGAQWFGLATFVHVLIHSAERTRPGVLKTYADPAGQVWSGRLCLPPTGRPGNRTLLASILLHEGEDAAAAWARALAANAAQPDLPPLATEELLIDAIADGRCDAGLIGSRALGRLTAAGNRTLLEKITVVWPNQADRGATVDVVAAGLARASDRREAVLKTLAWLAGTTGQRLLAAALHAYPVTAGVPLSDPLTRWGPFKADQTPLAALAARLDQAGQIAQAAGWP